MTASDTTLTIASSPTAPSFTASDVGKIVVVKGAGSGGGDLQSTIASFTSSIEVELADAASTTTVSPVRVYWGLDTTAQINDAIVASATIETSIVLFPPGLYFVSDRLTSGVTGQIFYGSGAFNTELVVLPDFSDTTDPGGSVPAVFGFPFLTGSCNLQRWEKLFVNLNGVDICGWDLGRIDSSVIDQCLVHGGVSRDTAAGTGIRFHAPTGESSYVNVARDCRFRFLDIGAFIVDGGNVAEIRGGSINNSNIAVILDCGTGRNTTRAFLDNVRIEGNNHGIIEKTFNAAFIHPNFEDNVGPDLDFGPPESPASWAASTSYAVGDWRKSGTTNERVYRCEVAGTSGSSGPSWPTTLGDTVVDGGVTWRCFSESRSTNPFVLAPATGASEKPDFANLKNAVDPNVLGHETENRLLLRSSESAALYEPLTLRNDAADSLVASEVRQLYEIDNGIKLLQGAIGMKETGVHKTAARLVFYPSVNYVATAKMAVDSSGAIILGGDDPSTQPFIFFGTADPNGNVTALVGSLYLKTNGGTGSTLWIKESGTGNTGWVSK